MRLLELFRHALRGLLRARLRAGLTATGVAIASGSLVSMVAFAAGFQRQLEQPLHSLGLLNQIRVTALDEDGDEDEEEDDAEDRSPTEDEDAPPPRRLDEAALEELRALEGVSYAAPDMRTIDVEVRVGDERREARAMGLPRELGLISMVDELVVAGSFFSLENEPEALLGAGLAKELGFERPEDAVGATLIVSTAQLALEGREVRLEKRDLEFVVQGVFEPPGFAFRIGSRGVLLPIDQVDRIPGLAFRRQLDELREGGAPEGAGLGRVLVGARSTGDVGRLKREIEDLGFRASTMLDQLDQMRTAFVFMDVLLASVGAVALIVAGLGILNTLLVTVLERTSEIGVYKAVGASDGDVRAIFLGEAAAIGLAGGLGGLVLAGIVTSLLQLAIDAYARSQGVPQGVVAFHYPLWLLVGSVAFAVVVSVASGVYPASRAARVDPIEALRGM